VALLDIVRDPDRLAVLRHVAIQGTGQVQATGATGATGPGPGPDPCTGDEAFDRLTRIGQALLGVPAVVLSIVEEDRLILKSAYGVGWAGLRERPLERSFCQFALLEPAGLLVPDALADVRFADNAATRELGIRGYLGVAIHVRGQAVGTLALIDLQPRDWTAREAALARDLAACVSGELEARAARAEAEAARRQSDAMAQALAAERNRLEAILEQLPVGVLLSDPSRGHPYANAFARETFGGTSLDVDPGASQAMSRALAGALAGTVLGSGELTVRGADGAARVLRATAAPIRDAAGATTGAIMAFHDITEVRRAEAEAERLRDMFIGMLGHDLRNPLAPIMTAAELLQRSENLTPIQLRALRRIADNAAAMARLIGDLLDVTQSRLGGGIPVHRRPTNLREVVARIIEQQELVHPDRAIRLVDPIELTGSWDEDRLCQVLANLVRNALEHGAPGSPVTLRLERAGEAARVHVWNGGAIAPEVLPVMFDPFSHSSAHHRGRRNLGLGLYIAQQIAHAHGGELVATSSAEAGTTFTLVLPLA
jgi:signal transduction histidine kinase